MQVAQFPDVVKDAALDSLAIMPDHGHEDPLTHLKRQRTLTLDRLRRVAPELVEQLEGWDKAIAAFQPAPNLTYARHLSGADALVEFLKEHGPTDRLQAIRAVAVGGWAYDRDDPVGILHDAVDYQLGKSKNPKIISLGDNVIGLPTHVPPKGQSRRKT